MLLSSLCIFSAFAGLASAHFQLQFPPPRGPFVEDDEPTFCDKHLTVNNSRTEVSLTDSFISINSEHPQWTIALLVSNSSNPTSFQDFEQVTPFTRNSGEGLFCMPLDLTHANATFSAGQNVTFQLVFDGGDGELFQCADVTLTNSTNNTEPSGCTSANIQTGGGNGSASGTTSGGGSTPTSGASKPIAFSSVAFTMGFAGLFLSLA